MNISAFLIVILIIVIIIVFIMLILSYNSYNQCLTKESGLCPFFNCADPTPGLCGGSAFRIDGDKYYCSGSTLSPKTLTEDNKKFLNTK